MRVHGPSGSSDQAIRGFEHIPTDYQRTVAGGHFGASLMWFEESNEPRALVLRRSSDAWSSALDQPPKVTRIDFFDQVTGASLGSVYRPQFGQSDAGAGQRYDELAIPERYAEAANVVVVIHADLHTGEHVMLRTLTDDEA